MLAKISNRKRIKGGILSVFADAPRKEDAPRKDIVGNINHAKHEDAPRKEDAPREGRED